MKKIAILILLALTASTALAQTPQQLMLKGNEAYSHGDYEAAADAYEVILATGLQSAELYYNLGNAYYRQEELGQAILNYERALRLNPHFRDARENLDLCYSKTEDGIESLPQIFLVQWAQAIVNWFSPTGWLVAIIILFALLGALVVIFFVSSDYDWRKRQVQPSQPRHRHQPHDCGQKLARSPQHRQDDTPRRHPCRNRRNPRRLAQNPYRQRQYRLGRTRRHHHHLIMSQNSD